LWKALEPAWSGCRPELVGSSSRRASAPPSSPPLPRRSLRGPLQAACAPRSPEYARLSHWPQDPHTWRSAPALFFDWEFHDVSHSVMVTGFQPGPALATLDGCDSPFAVTSTTRSGATVSLLPLRLASPRTSTICSRSRSQTRSRSQPPGSTHPRPRQRVLAAVKNGFGRSLCAHYRAAAERLVQLADERGLVLIVGPLLCYHPGVRPLADLDQPAVSSAGMLFPLPGLNLGNLLTDENALWILGSP